MLSGVYICYVLEGWETNIVCSRTEENQMVNFVMQGISVEYKQTKAGLKGIRGGEGGKGHHRHYGDERREKSQHWHLNGDKTVSQGLIVWATCLTGVCGLITGFCTLPQLATLFLWLPWILEFVYWNLRTKCLYKLWEIKDWLFYLRAWAAIRFYPRTMTITSTKHCTGLISQILPRQCFMPLCVGGSSTDRDKIKLNKLVKRAGSVLGCRVDSIEEVADRRMLARLTSINLTHVQIHYAILLVP